MQFLHFSISPGSAETLIIRRGGITNHHLIAYSQKLPKSVDVWWSYSVRHQGHFWDTVYVQKNSLTPVSDCSRMLPWQPILGLFSNILHILPSFIKLVQRITMSNRCINSTMIPLHLVEIWCALVQWPCRLWH